MIAFIVVCTVGCFFAQTAKPSDPATVAAENDRIKAQNAAMQKALEAGNLAISKKDYDGAIDIYDAAINADPTHPGLPLVLVNKAYAQMSRGTEVYNMGIANNDNAVRDTAKYYFQVAADTTAKAVTLARSLNYTGVQLYSVLLMRKNAMQLFTSRVDLSATADAGTAYNNYLAVETDPAKQEKGRVELGELFTFVGDGPKAKAEFEKVLAASPKNTAALFGFAFSLLTIGSEHDDKVLYQQSANYFKAFLDMAPANDLKRNDAIDSLALLKTSYNTVPK